MCVCAEEMNSNNIAHFFALINSIKAFSGQYLLKFFLCLHTAQMNLYNVFVKFIANTFRLNNAPHSIPHSIQPWKLHLNEMIFFPFIRPDAAFLCHMSIGLPNVILIT